MRWWHRGGWPPPADAGKASVFLCHSSADTDAAAALSDVLVTAGHRVWSYHRQQQPGADWATEMLDAVLTCDVLVFLASSAAVASPACSAELTCAREHGRKVVVVDAGARRDGLPRDLTWLTELLWITDGGAGQLLTALASDYPRVRALARLDIRATDWDRQGRPRKLLLGGADVAAATPLLDRPDDPLAVSGARPTPVVRAYHRASASRRRYLRVAGIVTGVLVVTALVATLVVAADRARQSRDAQRAELLQQLHSEAQRRAATDPATALRLQLAAYTLTGAPAERAALAHSVAATPLRRLLPEPGNKTRALAYTRDGAVLLSGGLDHQLRAYLPNASSPATTAPAGQVTTIMASSGSDLVAVGDDDGPRWERVAADGSIHTVATLPVDPQQTTLTLSGNGTVLAACGVGGRVELLTIDPTGKATRVADLPLDGDGPCVIRFAAGAPLLAVADSTNATVWDLAVPGRPSRVATFPTGPAGGPHGTSALAFTPDRGGLAISDGHRVAVYSLAQPAAPATFTTPEDSSTSDIVFVPPAAGVRTTPLLATITAAGSVDLWDYPARPDTPHTVLHQDGTLPTVLAARPDGTSLAVGGEDGSVAEWLADPRGAPRLIGAGTARDDIDSMALSRDTATLAETSPDLPTVELDHLTDSTRTTTPAVTGRVAGVVRDETSDTVVIGTFDGRVTAGRGASLDRPRSGVQPGDPNGDLAITSLQLAPGGGLLATANGLGAGFVWRIGPDALTAVGELRAASGPVEQVAVRPDGAQVAAAGRDGVAVIYAVGPTSLTRVVALPAEDPATQERAVAGLTWLPDGRHLAFSTELGIEVFDPDSTTPTRPVARIADDAATVLAAVPDSTLLLSWRTGTLTVYDVSKPAAPVSIARLPAGAAEADPVSFTADGGWLALAVRSAWTVYDADEAVATARDPRTAACLAAATASLPADLASALAALPSAGPSC